LSLIGLETDYAKRITLGYDFIVQNILYDFDKISTLTSDYIPIPDKTLLALKGICYDYSSLFAAMKRSEGVPIKLVKGYSTLVDGYHAWNEVFIDGKWIVVDTTVDAAYYKGKVKFSFSKDVADYTKVYEY
jgi:transglutaminase-like putative cysteine protease